jgi:hypothetical protein
MIITHGNVADLGDKPWYMVELRSEKTAEATLRRLANHLPNVFKEAGVELFIPILQRDFNVFALSTGSYIFARSMDFQGLFRLKSITGIAGLVTHRESNHPSKVIPVENQYVQMLISSAESSFINRADSIAIDSFVRIIDGENRDFCGVVIHLHDGTAFVQVDLKTKLVFVETPTRNLADLTHIPAELRVFYYADVVNELEDLGLIAEDLRYVEDTVYNDDDGLDVEQTTKHSRQKTVTALVKRMIQDGTKDPTVIAQEVVQALLEGKLRMPRNVSIIHSIIKTRLLQDHFWPIAGDLRSYREAVTRFGPEWAFPLSKMGELAAGLNIPLTAGDASSTEDDE